MTCRWPQLHRHLERVSDGSFGTFRGPGEGAVPGAGRGNAVERAVWNVTAPIIHRDRRPIDCMATYKSLADTAAPAVMIMARHRQG
jgi:hypothetical protein